MPLDYELQTEKSILHETWTAKDCEKHQHVENLSLHPFEGDIEDGRLALQVV